MNTKRKKQKIAPIPQGYRRMKVGDRRVKGYRWWSGHFFVEGFPIGYGRRVTKADMMDTGTYIAPIRRKRK